MDKIIFENLPSTNTPVSAENLNLMQSNIEKSVVAVGKTQPSTGENVWIKKGKNLFDNTFIQMRDDAPSTIRIEGKKILLENVFDTPQAVSLSNNLNLSTYKWSVNIKTNTGGNYDYDSGWLEDTNSWTVSQSRISEFMSRGNAQIYFVIAKKDGTNIYVSEMNNYNFQIEVGTTATTYEPYVEKEILVKNDNGIFEHFYSQREIENIKKILEQQANYTFKVNRKGSNNTYAQIATTVLTEAYQEKNMVLIIKGTHNTNNQAFTIANVSVSSSANGEVNAANIKLISSTTVFSVDDIKLESNGTIINVWLRLNSHIYASYRVSVTVNDGFTIGYEEKTTSASSLPTSGYTLYTTSKV